LFPDNRNKVDFYRMDREAVAGILRDWGFHVEYIEENFNRKTPDLLVRNNSEKYLVEVKTRVKNEPYPTRGKKEPFETIKRRLNRSAVQLNGCREKVDFRLTWFSVAGLDCASRIINQVMGALYGVEIENRKKSVITIPVVDNLYCRRAIFNLPTPITPLMDAVVLQDNYRFYLCCNDRGNNYEELEKSRLQKLFKQKFTVISP